MLEHRFALDSKVAIVTGAGRGLGRTMALALANAGATVVAAARTEEEIQETVKLIGNAGGTGLAFSVDVCDSQAVDRLVSHVLHSTGRIDILVNNAGGEYNIQKPALDMTDDEWTRILTTNLTGAFYCTRAVAHQMLAAGWGRIINVACIYGIRGSIAHPALAAAKGGLIQLTQALALEWSKQGVTVNTLGIGWFEEQLAHKERATPNQRLLRAIPVGRFGVPDDIDTALVYLASDASRYLTGQSIWLDGGILCR